MKERFQPEFRVEMINIFNHTNWGAPVTGFTAINFLQFTPSNSDSGNGSGAGGTPVPGPRRIQFGFRLSF